jgi:flavin reductase (DIM6/NTAB) family NADH-FMN oxidoreductase RutF
MMTSSANEASSPADGGLASVPFDSRQLRDALGVFPTGIIVLTGHDAAGERIGMTMSSFNSVSLEPPLVLFSIHRAASSFSKWQQCSRFAINVLGEDQEELSNRFSRSQGAKWEGISPIVGKTGVPLLGDALVAFECEAHASYDGGDHVIFVVKVVELYRPKSKSRGPILFYGGKYRRLDDSTTSLPASIEADYLHGW